MKFGKLQSEKVESIVVLTPDALNTIVQSAILQALCLYGPKQPAEWSHQNSRVFTFAEVRLRLNISAPTLRKMLAQGDIAGIRAGTHWRITEASLEAYFQKKEQRK